MDRKLQGKSAPEVYRLLEKYKNNREIVVFRTREQADKFIEKLG